MTIAIIDDEADARFALKRYLEEVITEPKAIGEADGVSTGLELIHRISPDVVFLDVMMKDGTGFDVLNKIPSPEFKVIFVSAHDEFAIRAFRFSAIDYLLKPVNKEDLSEALNRLTREKPPEMRKKLEALNINSDTRHQSNQRLVLKDIDNIYIVEVSHIIRCEASNNYTTFYLTDMQPILISRPLKEFEDLLGPLDFLRVHQSHLINLKHMTQFQKKEGGMVIMKDGTAIPVSQRKKEILLKKLH